ALLPGIEKRFARRNRQKADERRALAVDRFDAELAAQFPQNRARDRKAEAGAELLALGREKRVEDALQRLGRDAGARVADRDRDEVLVGAHIDTNAMH